MSTGSGDKLSFLSMTSFSLPLSCTADRGELVVLAILFYSGLFERDSAGLILRATPRGEVARE